MRLALAFILLTSSSTAQSVLQQQVRAIAASPTGPHRIKGQLPRGTTVMHKTGSSGSGNGVTYATNDIGLITIPDGRREAIAVFVTDSHADEATRDAVIARIAKAAFDESIRLQR